MGDICCKEVCDGILQNYTLKILNLSKNNITDVGASYVAAIIKSGVV